MRRTSVKPLSLLFVLILLFCGCKTVGKVVPSGFEERLLATIPEKFDNVSQETFSPDGKQVAYSVKAKNKEFVVLNDKPGPEYDAVYDLQFSHDGGHFAYVAEVGKKYFAVIDGKQGLGSDVLSSPVLSKDGRHVAYSVMQDGKEFVVVDDAIGPRLNFVLELGFAPDGDVIYLTNKGGDVMGDSGWVLMMGKDELPLVGNPSSFAISPDFQSWAYTTTRNDGDYVVVVNNKAVRAYRRAGSPLFSPNGKLLAYAASDSVGTEFLVALKATSITENGETKDVFEESYKGPEFSEEPLDIHYLFFSSDGSRFAYQAGKDGKFIFCLFALNRITVTGERELTDFDPTSLPVFNGDGTKFVYLAKKSGKEFVVVGDQKGPAFDVVQNPVFSEDGKTILYGARQGRQLWRKVMDARE
jgi:Tol biopolymer transport system component